jgi:hypothetical protein
MGKFSVTAANIVGGIFVTWNTLLASGQLPDSKIVHSISTIICALQVFLTYMAYHRTPDGTIVPPNVAKFIDQSAAAGREIDTFHKPDTGPVSVAVSSNPGAQAQTEKEN